MFFDSIDSHLPDCMELHPRRWNAVRTSNTICLQSHTGKVQEQNQHVIIYSHFLTDESRLERFKRKKQTKQQNLKGKLFPSDAIWTKLISEQAAAVRCT